MLANNQQLGEGAIYASLQRNQLTVFRRRALSLSRTTHLQLSNIKNYQINNITLHVAIKHK